MTACRRKRSSFVPRLQPIARGKRHDRSKSDTDANRRTHSRKTVRNIRDGALKGFGIRVLPSGAKRFFIHTQRNGRRIWKIVGDANTVSLNEARRLARDLITSMRAGGAIPASPEETLFESVAEEVFRNYGRNWKPGTMEVNRGYLRNQILPWFAGR